MKRIYLFLLGLLSGFLVVAQPYPVTITTVAMPPANPDIQQYVSSGNLRATLQYGSPGMPPIQVYVQGRIECLSPTPFTIAVSPNFTQQGMVTLSPGVPVQLIATQQLGAFGFFNQNNLVVSGIDPASLHDAANNFRLPEGVYRICYLAKQADPASGQPGLPVSDPNLGCGTFNICASATAPQFTQPVSNFSITSLINTVNPGSPLVFAWTPPVSTCGGQMGMIRYDFEIHEMLENQTVTDAINNPPVFIKRQLPSSTFLFDTLLNKEVLQRGKQYVIRVRASAGAAVAVQKIDNSGYSRIEAFKYGERPPGPPSKPSVTTIAKLPVKKDENNPPDKGDDGPSSDDSLQANVCKGVVVPSNTTPFAGSISDLQDKDIDIGKFKLHTESSITKNKDGTYSGAGYIEWTPMVMKIRLRVKFSDIKINTDKAVYDGIVRTTTEPGSYTWSPIATADDITKAVGLGGDKAYKDVRDFINSKAKLINQALGNTPIDMPLGWDNDIAGTKVTIAIMGISFAATGTNLNVFTGFDVPEANGWLNMAGTNFCINPVGTVISDGTLYLPNDRDLNLGSGGNNWNFKFKGSSPSDTAKGTYVNIKNNKLEKVMARAEIAFPQNALVPEDDDGKVTDGSVISKIEFRFANWNDWMATVEMPHFQIKDAPGLSIHTSKVFYDHSNKEDPTGFKYPISTNAPAGNAFMGLYIEEMKMLLPEDFKTFNQSNKRTEFSAGNFVVESAGISADIKGKNIIGLGVDKTGEGSMGGFAFTLDNFELVFEKNTYKKGFMDGNFWLPVSSSALKYTGNLRVENDSVKYDFLIAPEKNYQFDVWAASVDLSSSSHISLKRDSLGAAVEAILSGDIGFTLSSSPKINFNLLKFDSLGIANRNPVTKKDEFWFHPGTWSFTGLGNGGKTAYSMPDPLEDMQGSYAGPSGIYASYEEDPDDSKGDQSVGGFPISINVIKPIVNFKSNMTVEAGIGFTINVGIGGKDKTIISASAGLSILGEMKFDINGLQKPGITVKGLVNIDSLKVKGDVGPLQVDGALYFYKSNPTFGDGVKGRVVAKFPIATIEATAQFGNVTGFNYWFIDACASFKKPVPIAGFLGLGGFGGGAYYNMSMVTPEPDVTKLEGLSLNANAKDMSPGKSMSGVSYAPQSGVFGLKASAILTMSSSGETFNAKITLKAEFLEGAINKFGMEGQAYFITDYPENKTPAINAVVDMVYDIPKETFSLSAKVNAKIATVTAYVPIGVFSSPAGWYIKVGDPFGERAKINFIDAKGSNYEAHLGATAYFMAGSLIEVKLPDLPTEVSSKIQRDPGTIQLLQSINQTPGDGFMLGARVDGNFRASFAILYASAKAIVGFDLGLKHFKEQISCNGTPMGWNNWYAVGQLYAYLAAEVGVHVDIWFYEGDLSLCKIEVAAALQGGLPNPSWAEGSAYVHGEVLGGLVSVSQDFHVRIGDKCYPAADPLKDIQIISDYGPKKDGDVYDNPYLVSNVGLENNFTLNIPPSSNNANGEVRTYQFKVTKFELYKNNQLVPSRGSQLENNNTVMKLKFQEMFDPRSDYTAKYSCEIWQYYPKENRWDYPLNDKTQKKEPRTENGEFSFKTGDAPEYITDNRVDLLYPVKYQRYVLRNEFGGKGSMYLDCWPKNILIGDGIGFNAVKKYSVKYIAIGKGDTTTASFQVDEANRKISFALPPTLKNNTIYKAEFWSLPGGASIKSLFTVKVSNSTRNYGGVAAQVKNTTVTEASKQSADHDPIYVTYFRTGNYNSLQDKMNAYGNWNAIKGSNYSLTIQNDEIIPEPFDEYETKGFSSPNGTSYPGLLNAGINWDKSRQNDGFAEENIYAAKFSLALNNVNAQLGMDGVRDWMQPVYTLDYSKLPTDKPLNTTETGEYKPKPSGMIMYKPMGTGGSVNQSVAPAMVFYASMKWQRDYYINQDFTLMKNFANGVAPLMQQFQKQFKPSELQAALENMNEDYVFSWNWLGGVVSMPLNRFYNLYTNNTAMGVVNKLRSTNFMEFQKGKRNLFFQYRLGTIKSPAIIKSFNY